MKTYIAKQPITLEAIQWNGIDGISQIKKEFPSIQIIEGTKILPDITYETTVNSISGVLSKLSVPAYFIQSNNGEMTELLPFYYIVREYHVYPPEHFERKYQEFLGDKKS